MKHSDAKNTPIKKGWAEALKAVSPRPIKVSRQDMVNAYCFDDAKQLPLVIEPKLAGIKLHIWIESIADFISEKLLKHGGLLFRGFAMNRQADFEEFIDSTRIDLMPYMESATPRTQLGDRVYTSTEFPADQTIALHNELTYVSTWPMKICFFCERAAGQGGQTPIADVRRVFNSIREEIRDEFMRKGWLLVRNYGDGFGPTWQEAFHLTDKQALEDYCRRNRIEYEWQGANRLRTWQARPAVATHPKTKEKVWFNHIAFWHVSSLDPQVREMLLSEFGEKGLPYSTFYGDGTAIEDSIIKELNDAYRRETVTFTWQSGDLLLLDNMLVAHGRAPFTGARRVLVAMGEGYGLTN